MRFVDNNPEINRNVNAGLSLSIAQLLTGFLIYEYVGGTAALYISPIFFFGGVVTVFILVLYIVTERLRVLDGEEEVYDS